MDFDEKTSVISTEMLTTLKKEKQAESRNACFVVLTGGQAGRMYKLEGNEAVIGRITDAIICIEDDGVSRRHAKLVRQSDGTVMLVDLGSTNGTFCNGAKVDNRVLQDGDKIQIGTTTILKFSFQDTVEEDFQRRQYESVTRDVLTNCFNKKYFLERLPSEVAFAARHGKLLSLAMIDVDHFKKVNDTYGHQAGDHVLRAVATVIEQTIRADDILARYGGEEFVIIMRETPADDAFTAAERIRRKVESTAFVFEGTKIPVTISLGIATWAPGRSDAPEELIRIADEYLYKAKRSGRNRSESGVP
jgi:two-component system, cell cycle response regulator